MADANKGENIDRLADDLIKSEDVKKKETPQKKPSKAKTEKPRWRKKAFLVLIWAAIIPVSFLSYNFVKNYWVHSQPAPAGKRPRPVIYHVKRFPVQHDRSIKLDDFIIPFEERGRYTYIALSISFELPNTKLMDEMIAKNDLIRGIIYSILSKNIKILIDVSSLEKIKALITRSVNAVLTTGKVDEPIFTGFTTV